MLCRVLLHAECSCCRAVAFLDSIRHGVKFRRCDAGERIFLEHDAGDCLYVVHTGRVDVITFGTVLESLGAAALRGPSSIMAISPKMQASPPSSPSSTRQPS
jgi:hypothetical protein